MRRFFAAALALVMTVSVLSGMMIVSAASNSFMFTNTSAIDGTDTTYVYKEKTYNVRETQAGANVNSELPGITMKVGADKWYYTADAQKYNGISYSGRVTGFSNPDPENGTGVYLELICDSTVQPGTLEVMYQVGADKAFYITEDGSAVTGYDGITYNGYKFAAKTTQSTTFDISANHTYHIYVVGSKASFYGVTYLDKAAADEAKKKAFADEIAAFSFDKIKGDNTDENHVDSDLLLSQNQSYESKFGSCDVRWDSSAPNVIANDGNVNCQAADTAVVLTGTFSVQEDDSLVATKTFNLTVLADTDDLSAVESAKAALTLGDTTAIKSDITLPSEGKKGTSITWSTSNASVIEANGTIHRAAGSDQTATLTATITRGNETASKDFTVTVTGVVALTIESYLYADKDGNTRVTPIDGGMLKSINATKCEPISGEDDNIIIGIYKNDNTLKDCKIINMSSLELDKSTKLDINLPMDSTDTFKLFAMNLKTLQPYVEPFTPNDTLADGAKIYVVGDSTASEYADNVYPRRGWAQMLGGYYESGTVKDLALSGRSSLDFKTMANYATLQNSIKKGDYLIIQFGHNDSKSSDPSRYTSLGGDRFTDGTYKQSMFEYVQLAWDKGAYPIIATSVSRRKLSDSGLEAYVKEAQELADELSIPCIDLYAATNGWINENGLDTAKDMFVYVKAYDSRFMDYANFSKSTYYKNGSYTNEDGKESYGDDTHLNINGADLIAQWAADEMKEMGIPITQKMTTHRAVYPLPSYAEATSVN